MQLWSWGDPSVVYCERAEAGHYDADPLRPLYIEFVFSLGLKVTYRACISLISASLLKTQDVGWCAFDNDIIGEVIGVWHY